MHGFGFLLAAAGLRRCHGAPNRIFPIVVSSKASNHWLTYGFLARSLTSDRILSHAIQTHVLNPSLLPLGLRIGRTALFPNNALGPPRVIPSDAEQPLIRRRCAETILDLVPVKVQDVYFGAGIERRILEVEEGLNVFDDAYCNKHFLYGLVELVIVRLIPEMAEKGVADLLEERLS